MVNMKLETGLALASLGLHAMFVLYVASYYIALSRPIEVGTIVANPAIAWQLLAVGIFLFGLPGFGLAGISYIIARRDVPRIVSFLLIAQGILMPLGMFYSSTLANNITEDYKSDTLLAVPQIFLIAGFAPIGLGAHLAKLKPMKRRTM
jgi:hypothetical protein